GFRQNGRRPTPRLRQPSAHTQVRLKTPAGDAVCPRGPADVAVLPSQAPVERHVYSQRDVQLMCLLNSGRSDMIPGRPNFASCTPHMPFLAELPEMRLGIPTINTALRWSWASQSAS